MTRNHILLILLLAFALGARAQQAKSVLCIGNSFTYFHDSHLRLAEIAESQGHKLNVNAQYVGGYTFRRHLCRDETLSTITYNRFDYVFLQDQSQTPALYGQNPARCQLLADDAKELADLVRCYSPGATIFIEQTWAYRAGDYGGFGSFDNFDHLLRTGTALMAEKAHAQVSPIGEAFAISRAERPDLNLYDPDEKHQSALGTYLKACVNYLLLFPQPFTPDATPCGNDPDAALYLRHLAERVVLR